MGPVTVIERPQPPSAQPSSIPHAGAAPTKVQNPGAARRRLLLEGPIVSTLLRRVRDAPVRVDHQEPRVGAALQRRIGGDHATPAKSRCSAGRA